MTERPLVQRRVSLVLSVIAWLTFALFLGMSISVALDLSRDGSCVVPGPESPLALVDETGSWLPPHITCTYALPDGDEITERTDYWAVFVPTIGLMGVVIWDLRRQVRWRRAERATESD